MNKKQKVINFNKFFFIIYLKEKKGIFKLNMNMKMKHLQPKLLINKFYTIIYFLKLSLFPFLKRKLFF